MSSQFSLSGQETFHTTVLGLSSEKGEAGSYTMDWSKLNIEETCHQ